MPHAIEPLSFGAPRAPSRATRRLNMRLLLVAAVLTASPLVAQAKVITSAGRSCDPATTVSFTSNTDSVSAFSQGDSGRGTGFASPQGFLGGTGSASNSGLGCGWGGGGYFEEFLTVTGLAPGEIIPTSVFLAPAISLEADSFGGVGFAHVEFAASSQNATIGRDEFLYNDNDTILHYTSHLGQPISRQIELPVDLGGFGQFIQFQVSAGASATATGYGFASILLGGPTQGFFPKFYVPDDYVYSGPSNFADIRVRVGDTGVFDRIYRRSEVVVGVPEPTTWALMVGGFLAVGGALRRRTRADARA